MQGTEEQDVNQTQEINSYCHDPNPGSMTGNAGAVSKGHPSYAKPQNRYIKGTIYSKIRSIS